MDYSWIIHGFMDYSWIIHGFWRSVRKLRVPKKNWFAHNYLAEMCLDAGKIGKRFLASTLFLSG